MHANQCHIRIRGLGHDGNGTQPRLRFVTDAVNPALLFHERKCSLTHVIFIPAAMAEFQGARNALHSKLHFTKLFHIVLITFEPGRILK
ncbi:hypothetical protein D3C74_453860 [compost metagenome]